MNFENFKSLNIGLYSYEFIRLYCHRKENTIIEQNKVIPNTIYIDDINNILVHKFLSFENLSRELANFLKEIYNISDEKYKLIINHERINTSSNRKKYQEYYNSDNAINLISEKDKIIIEKFNYSYQYE